jgi:hypothetical protein
MNARIAKLFLMLCSVSLLNLSALRAQDTNDSQVPQPSRGFAGRSGMPQQPGYRGPMDGPEEFPTFDIQIENGELSLAYFIRREQKNPWGTTNSTVPATIDNLSKYLRAIDPNLNIVLSPDVGKLTISNLKLNTRNPLSISQAVSVASGGTIAGSDGRMGGAFGGGLRGAERSLTFVANQRHESKPSVEVFNLSGYIQTLGKVDEKVVSQKLDELENNLIFPTYDSLHVRQTGDDLPTFRYHSGTKLLIVIGNPDAIEVTRKIVNALPGQQKYGKEDVLLDTPPPSSQN